MALDMDQAVCNEANHFRQSILASGGLYWLQFIRLFKDLGGKNGEGSGGRKGARF